MSFESDARFESALLEAGRADRHGGDQETARAWERLASSIGLALAEPALRNLGASGPARSPAPARASIPPAGARALLFRNGTLKLLLIGAIGGSALTAGWQLARRADSSIAMTATMTTMPTQPEVAALVAASPRGRAPGPRAVSDGASLQHVLPDTPARPATRASRHRRLSALGAAGSSDHRAQIATELTAEVGRLDAARAASARGDYDEAIAIVERYHRDFPRGRLGPDADVVAIEAAAASGDAAATSSRAARFLERHPDDPHAARVRRLAITNGAGHRSR